jgi:manganese/zinc/iron transport system ATP- binding protein
VTVAFHTHPDPPLPYGGRRHAHPALFASALEVRGLTVGYPHAARPVLTDVSFEVAEGCLAALVGPNGAGKSTLLKAVATLLTPRAGTIRIFGVPPGGCHHRTAYLPQRGDIDWRFPVTVERLVLTGRYVHLGWLRRPRRSDYAVVRRVMDRLGIGHLVSRPVGELSGGQQQRALVARALAQGADLLLLDEPFNNLDADTRADLLALFADLRAAGKTLVVATHDFDRPEEVFDDVIRLRDGRREPAGVPA